MIRPLVGSLVLLSLAIAPGAAADARAPVVVGEVSASVASALPDARDALRRDVEREIGTIAWSAKARGRKLILSAALVRLESVKTEPQVARTSCTVSATLRDERGALIAILEGRARAEDDPNRRAETERDALSVAVRGAIHRLPEAVEHAP